MIPLLMATLVAAASSEMSRPAVDGDLVVVNTTAGGLVIRLDPSRAPRTVEQFKKLVEAGIYDGTRIYRVQPNFLIQTSLAEDRDRNLTSEQRALLQRIPREQTGLRHLRGAVSMAHSEGDPDGADSSFSILLQDAPHLDGNYTVFGHVESGLDVVDEIGSLPVNSTNQPLIHVSILRAEVAATAQEAASRRLVRRYLNAEQLGVSRQGIRLEVALLASTILFAVMSLSLLGARLPRRAYGSVRVAVLFIGGFGLLLVLLPLGPRVPLVGLGLLCLLLLLFKSLGRFEPPAMSGTTDRG